MERKLGSQVSGLVRIARPPKQNCGGWTGFGLGPSLNPQLTTLRSSATEDGSTHDLFRAFIGHWVGGIATKNPSGHQALRRRQKAECRMQKGEAKPTRASYMRGTSQVRARYEPSASQVHGRYMLVTQRIVSWGRSRDGS